MASKANFTIIDCIIEQAFNSLHAQREACEAYIKSQRAEGWALIPTVYDDGGISGGTLDRPALTQLIAHIEQGNIDIIVVYKVDRLSRSLADFVRLVELFDRHGVSFVSVTQQFNTSNSMGRLTLNVLLSFAQFEREVTGERIRDKIAASKKKGLWMGGVVPLGFDVTDKQLVVNQAEAVTVRRVFERYRDLGCVRKLKAELDASGTVSKVRDTNGRHAGGKPISRGALYAILKNPLYVGKVNHQGELHEGQHDAIVDEAIWCEVQQMIVANRRKSTVRTNAKEPSLLAGLLLDDANNPMSPTHATKRGRRYRYYVSQALLQYRDSQAGSVVRIPAKTLEDTITAQLLSLLNNANRLLNVIGTQDLSATQHQQLIDAAQALAAHWPTLAFSAQLELLGKLLVKITLSKDTIRITFSRAALRAAFLIGAETKPDRSRQDAYEAIVPAQLKRCGIETRLVVTNGEVIPAHNSSVDAIRAALAKALAWNDALVNGTVASMTELAARENVTQRYIAHLIKLAFLAPDIMRCVARGDIPPALSLDRLKKGFPLDWTQQRKVLGFKAQSNA